MHLRRRALAVLCAVALLTPVALGFSPAEAARPEPAPAAAPRATPAAPLLGERFDVTGKIGSSTRAVKLQRRSSDGSWTTVASGTTTRTGRYAFVTRARSTTVVLRVLAPATSEKAKRRTGAVTVTTTAETSSLSLTGNRPTLTVVSTLSPARTGRVLRLQVLRGGSWRTLAEKTQTSSPTQGWPLADPGGRPQQYRLVALGFDGSAPYVGTAIALTPYPAPGTLPRITLSTEGAKPVASREEYVSGTLQVDDGAAQPMQIKGRGNSTWAMPKKPYRIKLATKAGLLGMPEEKDWVLLANFADRSALRTWTAFGIAAKTSLGWTPDSRFVDVTLNGIDIGLYQLTEQIEANKDKVALKAGGLLLEVDSRYVENEEPGFTSPHGMPLAFKDPGEPTESQKSDVGASVSAFETALYGPDYLDPVTGYAKYVDLDSFADWYLVNELMKNLDSDFWSSVFVSWDPAGTFTMGPVWDFDFSSGYARTSTSTCCASTQGWWLRFDEGAKRQATHNTHWLTRMITDPAFLARVEQRWRDVVGPATGEAIDGLAAQQALIATSAAGDRATWHADGQSLPGTVHAPDQPGETDYLISWLTARRAWMESQLG
ncbi:CotH kinase family protein [Marmoricola sp. OAE513]|uniref:CotH kinase family protein n=1 Tax=Marmoricola sp. OAE513 TaxID=2817894 RepID=UPI001AEA5474